MEDAWFKYLGTRYALHNNLVRHGTQTTVLSQRLVPHGPKLACPKDFARCGSRATVS